MAIYPKFTTSLLAIGVALALIMAVLTWFLPYETFNRPIDKNEPESEPENEPEPEQFQDVTSDSLDNNSIPNIDFIQNFTIIVDESSSSVSNLRTHEPSNRDFIIEQPFCYYIRDSNKMVILIGQYL